MPTLSKDALKPGVYRKGEQMWVVPRERINDLHDSFGVLKEKGYRFPMVMEHPGLDNEQSYPVHESDDAKIQALEEDPMFVGWVKDLKVAGNHTLRPEIDIEDEKQAKKLSNRGAFVSPQFGPFTDRDGETHFAFHHLALTRKPVMKDQQKQFVRVSQFSEAEPIDDGDVYVFGLESEVLEFDNLGGSGGFDTTPDSQVPDQDADSQSNQDTMRMKRAFQQALSSMGVHVANDSPIFNDADAMQQLMSLLHGCVSKNTKDQNMPATQKPNDQQQAGGAGMPGADERQITVTMSEADKAEMTKLQNQVAALSASNDIQQMALTKLEQEKLNGRIAAAEKSGRMNKKDADDLRTLVGTYQFSEATKTENVVAVARLETFERLPAGTFFTEEQKIAEFNLGEHNVGETQFARASDDMSEDRLTKAMEEEGFGNPSTEWRMGLGPKSAV